MEEVIAQRVPRYCPRSEMTATLSEGALRRAICDAGRVLYDRGLIGPTDGNFSARLGDRYLLCTPSATHKGELRPEQLVKLTLDGRVVGDGKPSSELKMHLAIYKLRPEVKTIVHAHPPCAVGLTVAGVSRVFLVVSDGRIDDQAAIRTQIERLRAQGTPTFFVAVGPSPDAEALRQLAGSTDRFFSGGQPIELGSGYANLATWAPRGG